MVATRDITNTEVYLGDRIVPGSFGWLVPVSDTTALGGMVSSQRPNGHMSNFLSTLRATDRIGESIDRPKHWGIPLKPLGQTYGQRIVVVGDAAGHVKPTTGGGIYYALLSGEIAAETIDEALQAGDTSELGLKGYEERWKATFGNELKVGYCARLLYEALGDDQIETLLSDFMSIEVQESLVNSPEFSFDWHARLILKALRRTGIGNLIRSFGPRFAPLMARLMN